MMHAAYGGARRLRQDRPPSHPGLAHRDHRTQRLARRHASWRSTQPAVSAQLKRLRALTGDPLLVRAGTGMAPTETALAAAGAGQPPAARGRAAVQPAQRQRGFDPRQRTPTFRIAASDYLDPLFLPELVARHQARGAAARGCELLPLSARVRLPRAAWRTASVDLVIGNWLEPPAELHLGRLIDRRGGLPGRPRTTRPRA
ncbi:MAG: LysR family transcriptional regulator [Comamonadaceae bacterium]|nr:LysR family transcriptional regulator [Comamonadaceae bacterium]